MINEQLGFEVRLNQPFEQAIESVTAALKTQGFGILTRIDVRATLKEKLGVDFRPYVILGACNPPLAHRAIEYQSAMALLLPCNVTVEQSEAGQSLVRLANPLTMLTAAGSPNDLVLQEIATDALNKIQGAVAELMK